MVKLSHVHTPTKLASMPFVYIVEPRGSNVFKVGMSLKVETALSRYRTHCGFFVIHFFESEAPRRDEAFMHSELIAHRENAEFFSRGDGDRVIQRAFSLAVSKLGNPILVHDESARERRRALVIPRDRTLRPQHFEIEEVLQAASQPAPSEGEPDGMTTTIRSILEAQDYDAESSGLAELQKRIMGNEATEADKWADFKHRYKSGWAVDRVDEPFLRRNGVQPTSSEVQQLVRVLYPPLCQGSADASVAARASLLKAPLIRDVIDALGLKSPFDTETEIKDLPAVWEKGLKGVEMFRDYPRTAKLFTSAGRTSEWTVNTISKALGMVLGSVGLSLDSKSKRVQRKGEKTIIYVYKVNPDKAARMLELVRLKMRGSEYRAATPNAHARELLLRDEYPKYGHLVDLERKGRTAFAFVDA